MPKTAIISCALAFITSLSAFLILTNITTFFESKKVLGIATTQAQESAPTFEYEKKYWLDIVSKHPTYRDGYLELAQIEIDLGNKEKAALYIQKARMIDPNSSIIARFEEKL